MVILNKSKIKITLLDIILAVVSIFFVIGINFWFHGCDTTTMPCHYAENVIKALSYLLLGLSLIKMFIPSYKIKFGITISMIAIAIIVLLVPGTLIPLCKYETMACNKEMKPFTIMFGVIYIVAGLVDLFFNYLNFKKEK